jgi:CBS domain-containing protein
MDTLSQEVHGRYVDRDVLSEVFVKDVMTKDVISILKYAGVNHAVTSLSENCISGLPVVDRENRVIGIISEADILSMVGMGRGHTFRDILRHMFGEPLPERKMGDHVGDVMTSPAVTIGPGKTISEAARVMDEKKVKRLPVVDDSGHLLGIISRADIVRVVSGNMKGCR